VLLGLQSEGVHVDAGIWGAGVVQVGHVLVEELALLLLEAVLSVQHQLELVQRTHLVATNSGVAAVTLLNHVGVGGAGASNVGVQVGSTNLVEHLTSGNCTNCGGVDSHVHVGSSGGEVPQSVQIGGGAGGGVLVAPDQLLHWVVEAQTDQSRAGLGAAADGVTAGVLHLLNQVLVALLGKAAALLSVQVHVVGPHLNSVGAEVALVVVGQVKVQADLVVLQGNQGQVQAGVAVEEEQQRQVHTGHTSVGHHLSGGGGQLAVADLVALTQEALCVQTEPGLVVLVNALATDGQLHGGNGTLSNPASIEHVVVGGQVGVSGLGGVQSNVHVANQVTVAGNGHGHTAAVAGGAVDSLLDHLHGEVGVALVHSLEEGHFGLSGKVNILCAVCDKLH